MMQPLKNMIFKHGSLDIMPIDNLYHVPIALISNQEILALDVDQRRKMYIYKYLGYLKEIRSYVKWHPLCN